MTCNVNLSMTDSQLQSLLAKNASNNGEACDLQITTDQVSNLMGQSGDNAKDASGKEQIVTPNFSKNGQDVEVELDTAHADMFEVPADFMTQAAYERQFNDIGYGHMHAAPPMMPHAPFNVHMHEALVARQMMLQRQHLQR